MESLFTKEQMDYLKARARLEMHLSEPPGLMFLISKGEKEFKKAHKRWKEKADDLGLEFDRVVKKLKSKMGN
jgi:hypothetical protein